MKGKLSREIKESLGVKQGQILSSDNYKIYIGPCLDTLEEAQLGVWIGVVNSGVSGVADDVYLCSDDPNKLQSLLDIAEHYGHFYRIKYGASKTKITVSGSDADIQFYADTQPWTMGGQKVEVVENNEHLGQIVSGTRQEGKNVDARIVKARNAIFSLLGPGFSYKCQLSPILKLHLYRTFVCPVLRSGLSSFVLTKTLMEPLNVFQRKVLKGILKFSSQASTSTLYFLTGELPIEAMIHKDVFSLFFSVWLNPNTKIYSIIKHISKNISDNSRTWSNYVKYLCTQYGLEDPTSLLQREPPKKSSFKTDIDIRIRAFHENEMRIKARDSEKLKYFNASLYGLSGHPHPALSNLMNTVEVKKSRYHLKMLIGDLYTYEVKVNIQVDHHTVVFVVIMKPNQIILHDHQNLFAIYW